MTQKETIKNLKEENELLREQIELKEKLKGGPYVSDIDYTEVFKNCTTYKEAKEPKLEVGWYKHTGKGWIRNHPTRIFWVHKFSESHNTQYSYVRADIWNDSDDCNDYTKNFIPATDKEVETALRKEAKKRGFKEGTIVVNHFSPSHNKEMTTDGEFYSYTPSYNFMHFGTNQKNKNVCIFDKGQWAEIIEESVPTICGYKMEVVDGKIKFGCLKFKEENVKKLLSTIENFNLSYASGVITSIEIDKKHAVTTEQLKEIVNYLNK